MNAALVIMPMLLLLLTGCRQNQQMQFYIDNLNAENRVLEDRLYELQYDYEVKLEELERVRAQLDGGSTGASQTPAATGAARSGGGSSNVFPEMPNLSPPTIEFGDPDDIEHPPADTDDERSDDMGPLEIELGDEARRTPAQTHATDQAVTRLYLNPALTGGRDRDGEPGDDGIRLVLEPRNDQNSLVRQPGKVSVVALDPQLRTRVARWDFDREQTALAFQRAQNGKGIQLDMPWPDAPPNTNRLHLFVRYWPQHGPAVQADREISITPPGQLTATWTPRTEARTRSSESHISVADKPPVETTRSSSPDTDAKPPTRQDEESNEDEQSAQQAELPEWKPYR